MQPPPPPLITPSTLKIIFPGIRGRDSVVGIATRYGLEGPGIESRSRPTLGPTQPPIQWIPGLFPWGKSAGAWRWPPNPTSAEVKETVELYLYSPSGPSWPVLEWTLPFTFTGICYLLHTSTGFATYQYRHVGVGRGKMKALSYKESLQALITAPFAPALRQTNIAMNRIVFCPV